MNFLIIIPAHNEEKNILFCLKSLQAQTYSDYKVVVVNDGSSDGTERVVKEFLNSGRSEKFTLLNLEPSAHQPGAKVVQTFNRGLATVQLKDFDVICKFDADIIFPKNYLSEIAKSYAEDARLGMVSGLVKIKKSVFDKSMAFDFKDEKKQWIFEDISSKEHIRGPIKSYRRECYEAMNGLRPALGWDNIDGMLAKMHGWEIKTLKNIWVKHLRPTAYKYKNQKAEKLGEYFYNIGLSLPLTVISSGKAAFKNKSFREFFVTMNSFAKQKHKREITEKEVDYIRKLPYTELFKKIGL